jgi:hypothetical protein
VSNVCLHVLKHCLDEIRKALIIHVVSVEAVSQIGHAVAAVLSIEGEDGAVDIETSPQGKLRVESSGEFTRKRWWVDLEMHRDEITSPATYAPLGGYSRTQCHCGRVLSGCGLRLGKAAADSIPECRLVADLPVLCRRRLPEDRRA